MKIAVFASGPVGLRVLKALQTFKVHVFMVVFDESNSIVTREAVAGLGITKIIKSWDELKIELQSLNSDLTFDLGILAWWPHIIKAPLIDLPTRGFLNFHPSLLPNNRGKNPNFWTFLEKTKFGVTIHWVDREVDTGPIAFQQEISKSWDDTGESLYQRSLDAIVELFEKNLPSILKGDIPRLAQGVGRAARKFRELETASKIDLDQSYPARDLLDLIRARTFNGHPGTWFEDQGQRYEVRISIKKID